MNIQPLIEQRAKGMSMKEIAQSQGLSYCYLRKVWSELELPSPERDRRRQISKLWGRGTAQEIAEYLDLDVATVKDIAYRMHLREGTRQLVLWQWCFKGGKRKAKRAA